jgi:lysozyme
MNITQKGLDIICKYEGFRAAPYICPAGKPTIGYGTTLYKSGLKVTMQDPPITKEQAIAELIYHIENRCYHSLIGLNLNQNQFDALCSFIYWSGSGNFAKSTLRKLIVINPKDPAIAGEFAKWTNSGLAGLVKRRKSESDLYFAA